MSVYLLVIRIEVPDDSVKLPKIAYQAPQFDFKRDRVSYADAASNVVKEITKSEIKTHRGCRQFVSITIETHLPYETDLREMEAKSDAKVAVAESKSGKSVADAVAEATNTASRGESPGSVKRKTKKLIKERSESPTKEFPGKVDSAIEESATSRPASGSTQRNKSMSPTIQMANTIRFFSGNPSVETTDGIIHLYKDNQKTTLVDDIPRSEMICMLTVPASMTSRDLLEFVAPTQSWIESMKIIKDGSPNKYMVLIKFKNQGFADHFHRDYNNRRFNMIEPEICHLVYVAKVEAVKASEGAGLSVSGLTELPTCPVCLERMDESLEGILTVLCNHSFHTGCLSQWGDTSCPVCRYVQTPEPTEGQHCMQCDSEDSLWICLICGNVGCGRYVGGHAYTHFQETQHTYSMQLGNNRVWDYAGDNYVHRLIQNKGDGKLVEVDEGGNVLQDEKMDSIQLEYTYQLTSQLESQRKYFEEKLSRYEMEATKRAEETEACLKSTVDKCSGLTEQLNTVLKDKAEAEKKLKHLHSRMEKVLRELGEEKELNKNLRKNQSEWQSKVAVLEKEVHIREHEIQEMKDQVRDLMFAIEGQQKIANVDASEASREEITEAQIVVGPGASGSSAKKSRKKTR